MIAAIVALAYGKFSPDEQDALCQGLQDIIDSHSAAIDQAMTLPRSGLVGPRSARSTDQLRNNGTTPLSRMIQSSNRGTSSWSEQPDDREETNWCGRPNTDSSAAMRNRRQPTQDATLAGARRQREEGGFLARYPEASHIRYGAFAY